MTHTLTSEGADASEDGTGRGTPIVAACLTARYGKGSDSDAGDAMVITSLAVAGDFSSSEGVGVAQTIRSAHGQPGVISVQPLAVRGRDGGAELEIGPEGGPYNCLRAGDGGSSRQSLVAIHENQRGELTTNATTGALNTGGGKPGQGYPAVAHDTVVRRLTPLECERLQGFPDDWTDGQSDAQRYRQMGNSLAVPVVEWIANRIVAVDAELDRE